MEPDLSLPLPLHPTRTLHQRTIGVTGVVVLAHAGILWLVVHQLASPALPSPHDQVILASVVAELPSPMAPPPQPAPARPAISPMPRLQRPAVQQSATPTISSSTLSETTPSTHVSPVPATTAPAATGSARPAPSATTAVVLPSSDADYLNNPPPAYPRMSRRLGEQGTVLVRVFISTEGRAEKAEIRTSSGYARLDEAALETVQRWRYLPGKRAGLPEAMWFNVPVRFVLD